MRVEHENNLAMKKFTIAFSPETAEECGNWYSACHNESMNKYKEIIGKVVDGTKKAFIVSCFQTHRKLNLVEKKKGIAGVYLKHNKEYQSQHEKLLEINEGDCWYSIAESSSKVLECFFVPQIPSMLCFLNDNTTEKDIFDYFVDNDFTKMINHFCKNDNLFLRFNDVGCDGNSITIYYDKPRIDLNKLLRD